MALEAPADGVASPHWRTHQVPCNLCGCTDFVELYPSTLAEHRPLHDLCACTSTDYGLCGPIVRCVECGLLLQNPQPVPEDLLAGYEDVVDLRYEEEREGRVHTFSQSLLELERHARPGRLLDVGAYLGVFVEVAQERGWIAEGVEPSRWAAEKAQARGLSVRSGSLDIIECDPSLDVITMWDVIEHLADPVGSLKRLRGALKPGGVLALSTMDVDAPVARLLGRKWPWYMQMHLYYFSRRTLQDAVERAGFEVIEIRRHRRIVRVAYLLSRLETRLGRLYRPLERFVSAVGLGRRLVGVDFGDIVTLFARKPAGPTLITANGRHA
jgi:2-polyprenyl-3-methyl-5-hydroxy-6-metoxy-1,4-benzoquinol methylase